MANDFIRGIKVYLDSQQASKSMQELTAKLTQYRTELAKLTAQGQEGSRKADRLRDSIQRLEKVESRYNDELRETEQVLRNLSGASVNELLLARNRLRSQLKTMKPDTEQYRQMLVTLQQTETQLTLRTKEMNAVSIETRSIFQRLSSTLNKYFLVLSTVATSIIAVIQAGRKSVQAFMDVEEALVRIRKYAGLSAGEVHRLSRELNDLTMIDTRTSHLDLLALAADAGRLGIKGTENLEAFVRAADRINLALGEDLGRDAVTNIGKLANLFGEDRRLGLEEAMLSTASAVTKLAKSSTACEPYLVNFASRLGGIGAVAGISTADILGLGSALDQNMQKVEMSSTALSTLITKIFQEPAKFARIAGMEVQAFTDLVKTDANEALLQFLTAMRSKGGFDRLAPMFQDMEMSGKRAVQVLSTLASHVDQVREAQDIASDAYERNVEVEYEFGLVNNTVQAQLEKRRKQLQALRVELGEELMPALVHIKTAQSLLVRSLKTTVEFFIRYKATILSVTASLALLALHHEKAVISEKLHVLWTDRLTVSMKKLWTAVKSHPFALLATVLAGVAGLFIDLKRRTDDFMKGLKTVDELRRTALHNVQAEIQQAKQLLAVLADENAGYEQRLAAISELNALSPEFLGGLSAETVSYDEAAAAVDRYIRCLQLQSQIESALAEQQNLQQMMDDVRENIENPGFWRSFFNHFFKNLGSYSMDSGMHINDELTPDEKQMVALKERFDEIGEAIAGYRRQLLDVKSETSAVITPDVVMPASLDDIRSLYEGPGGLIETEQDEFETMQENLDMALARRELSEEEHAVRLAHLKSVHYDSLIRLYARYSADLSAAVSDDDKSRETAVKAVHKQELKAQREYRKAVIDTEDAFSKAWEKMRALDGRSEEDGYQKIEHEYANRLKLCQGYYDAILSYIQENVTDLTAYVSMVSELKNTYEQQMAALLEWRDTERRKLDDKSSERELKDLRERDRIVSRYLKQSIRSQYEMELAELDAYHDRGLLSEKEYQKARMQIAFDSWMEGYNLMAKYASDMVESMQQAEIASVTRKYDILLREAENNGEDTAELEREQANAKLEIEKKYAMSDLLVKLSEITASTAVAIMTGFAQLGPVAGAVAAAMLTTTGLAQYAAALQEYNRIRGLSLESSPSSSPQVSAPALQRVVQYAGGRYDVVGEDDGRLYRDVPYMGAVTGIVERPALISESGAELIVSAPVLRRLRTHVNYDLVTAAINDARTGRVPQHAEGQYPAMERPAAPRAADRDAELLQAILRLTSRIDSLPREIRSYVLLDDLNTATELRRRAESPFRRTDRNTTDNGNKN